MSPRETYNGAAFPASFRHWRRGQKRFKTKQKWIHRHFEAKSGFTTAQSNEHQRRWTEKGWESANANGRIDRSRVALNFEIVRGGKVQAVDHSRSILEKFQENPAVRTTR